MCAACCKHAYTVHTHYAHAHIRQPPFSNSVVITFLLISHVPQTIHNVLTIQTRQQYTKTRAHTHTCLLLRMTLILTVTKTQNLTKAIKTTQRPQSRRRSSSIIITMLLLLSTLLFCAVSARDLKLILEDDFNTFNVSLWRHQITAGGGGNWEFELYDNNRTTSFVRDGALNIKPALMVDDIGKSSCTYL